MPNDWENRATRNPAEIRRVWGSEPLNVGVACGPSRIVVIDLDVAKDGSGSGVEYLTEMSMDAGQPWPRTMTVATPRGGRHLVFRAPRQEIRNSASTVGPHIDVRGSGGYVVGIGSVVDGVAYRLLNHTAPAPLPGWLLDAMTRPKLVPQPSQPPPVGEKRRNR